MIGSKETMRNIAQPQYTYHDRVFENEINQSILLSDQHYENMHYRDALKTGFYDLQTARDRYRDITAIGDGMNWQLVQHFIEVQALLLCPICPHVCEQIWSLLGKPDSIMHAQWPEASTVDPLLLKESEYLTQVSHEFRVRIKKMVDLREKKSAPSEKTMRPEYGVIYVAQEYPQWQQLTLTALRGLYNEVGA